MEIEPVDVMTTSWYRKIRLILPLVGIGIGAGLVFRVKASSDDVYRQFGAYAPNTTAWALGSLVLLGAILYGLGFAMDRRPSKKWIEYVWRALAIVVAMAVWAFLAASTLVFMGTIFTMGSLE